MRFEAGGSSGGRYVQVGFSAGGMACGLRNSISFYTRLDHKDILPFVLREAAAAEAAAEAEAEGAPGEAEEGTTTTTATSTTEIPKSFGGDNGLLDETIGVDIWRDVPATASTDAPELTTGWTSWR